PFEGWAMLVCNPVSGSGQGLARLALARRTLDAAGVAYTVELTRGMGHAMRLARAAVSAGCGAVVAIGGDGTFHEVVNGVMDLTSLIFTLWAYRNKRIILRAPGSGRQEWRGRANSVVVANGQYFGGGMKIAPDARLTDGELDVLVLGDLGKLELVLNLPRVYNGSHVTHPKARFFRTREVEVSSPD